MYMHPSQYAAEARAISELGFGLTRCAPASGRSRILKRLRLMREAVGPDFDLMVDAPHLVAHGRPQLSVAAVEKLAGELSQYSIAWLEEPLPPADHTAYRRLKEWIS